VVSFKVELLVCFFLFEELRLFFKVTTDVKDDGGGRVTFSGDFLGSFD